MDLVKLGVGTFMERFPFATMLYEILLSGRFGVWSSKSFKFALDGILIFGFF
jgi:hypothetical protein